MNSIKSVKNVLDTFTEWLRLNANPLKTAVYLGGVGNNVTRSVLEVTSYTREIFPFRYLSIPLCTSRITLKYCAPLFDAVRTNTNHWATKFLSYARKPQLINSIIFGLLNFWSACFSLPSLFDK